MNRILVIQDSPTINIMIKNRLEFAGFYVDIRETGEEGAEKAIADDYDLILLDCNLPGISGIEVYRILKKDENAKKVPVVFMSSKDKEVLAKMVKDEGAAGFIALPFEGNEFIQKIKGFISQ